MKMREGIPRAICTVYVDRSEDRLCYRKHNGIAQWFRTRFATIWRSEIHISLKVDADALNRRRCRFLLRCTTYHICQGHWR